MKAAGAAAVVVTFRSRPLIDRCLESLQQAGVGEVWVVDNASDDGTADHVASSYPKVHLIRSEQNLGFAAANNLALRRIHSDAVLLLNPDAWLAPGALETMLQVLDSDTGIGVVGPRIERQGMSEPSLLAAPRAVCAWLFLLSGMRAFTTGGFAGRPVAGYPWQSLTDGDHVRGSCMLLRRQALEDAGLLDDAFFLYFEETEWCLRLRRHGWRVVIAPAALVHHVGKASVGTQESLPSLEFMRSAVIFWQKLYGRPVQIGLRITLMLMAVVKWLLLLPMPANGERRRWLLAVAGLAMHPYARPVVFDYARRPPVWPAP